MLAPGTPGRLEYEAPLEIRAEISYRLFEPGTATIEPVSRSAIVPAKSCCLKSSAILAVRRRHSSAVEQLFRKSPALCAVLPCSEGRYKRPHLSAIRAKPLTAQDRRYGSFPPRADPQYSKWSHKAVARSLIWPPIRGRKCPRFLTRDTIGVRDPSLSAGRPPWAGSCGRDRRS